MNMLSRIAILLLSLSILAIPAMAAEGEEHLIIVRENPDNTNIVHLSHASIPGHKSVPEHAELRPFFRDSDPEFAMTYANSVGYPAEDAITTGEAMPILDTTTTTGTEGKMYEYAAIP